VLGVVPGSGLARKRWPAERFAEVASRVCGFDVVVILGGKAEQQTGREIAGRLCRPGIHRTVINLAGRTTLRELVSALARCDLVVGSDTGAMHMAVALDKPTVVVLGAVPHRTRFYPWSDRARHQAVYGENEAFGRITPDEVLTRIDAVLQNAPVHTVRETGCTGRL
jgi:ADP-heptose:LPS heptosyltransferase